jgi:SpoVK/Ycf46/Vps4 family AAA+-type ATPase
MGTPDFSATSWFDAAIDPYTVRRFSLDTTARQRAQGWLALFQQAFPLIGTDALTGTDAFMMSAGTDTSVPLPGTGILTTIARTDTLVGTDTSVEGPETFVQQLRESDALLLAERYPLSTLQMAQVFETIQAHAGTVSLIDLQQACLRQMHIHTRGLATFTLPRFTPDDMVLTAEAQPQLEELLARMRFRRELRAQTNGFLSGTQALFWGPPGTGKSMAAEAIAGALCLPLYQVNLANVASKWIGETEKHLADLFDQAEKQKAVLLFDEADAIFAKRSEVESSHDKNANLGVSFLLQRMETYQGILLLSTNFKANIDHAFLRRFTAVIEFPLPDIAQRKLLWQRAWQGELKPADNVDMDYLVASIELSPAQIRNVAERACLFALMDRASQIRQEQLAKALRRELDKQSAGFIAAHHLAEWLPAAQ